MCKSFESMGCMINKKKRTCPRDQKKQALGPIGVFLGGMGGFECASPLSQWAA